MTTTSVKLAPLLPILASASIGDFSKNVPIPDVDDEFTEIFVGIQLMLETIREQITALKQVDQAKTEFISLASHQLRSPLASFKWHLDVLLSPSTSNNLTVQQKTYLTNLRSAAQNLIDLANTILDISRFQLGASILSPQPTSPKTVVEQITTELSPQIISKNLHIQVQYPPQPQIIIDPKFFHTVLHNLLSNAIKYTFPNGRIELKFDISQDHNLTITVADTGPGIPKNNQPHIFTTKGEGLGLYLTKSQVNHYGGRIWFTSAPSGTIFYVTLPLS